MKNNYKVVDDKATIFCVYKDCVYEVLIDLVDLPLVQEYKTWWVQKKCNTFYAYTFVHTGRTKRKVYMHRLINKTPAGLMTDHGDHNGLNNTRKNLSTVTNEENQRNRRDSKHRYISYQKDRGKYRIKIKGEHIGYSASIEEAIEIRDKHLNIK